MMKRNSWIIALIFVVTAGSFLLELWPLAAVGVVAMGFVGRGWLALPLGFLLDLAYGAPLGLASYVFFPFSILALVVIVGRYWAIKYLFERSSRDTL